MKKKKTNGLSLVELIVTIGIMAVVITAAGSVIFSSMQTQIANIQIQENQVQIRMALLAMTRDAHASEHIIDYGPETLVLEADGVTITYTIEYVIEIGDYLLWRTITPPAAEGTWPIPFVPARISEFSTSRDTIENNDWLTIEIAAEELEVSTTISMQRIVMPD